MKQWAALVQHTQSNVDVLRTRYIDGTMVVAHAAALCPVGPRLGGRLGQIQALCQDTALTNNAQAVLATNLHDACIITSQIQIPVSTSAEA